MEVRPRLVLPIVVALVSAGCWRAPSAERGPPSPALTMTVMGVTDGDTVHVTYMGHDERVRLIGVNAPEVGWYGSPAECFGQEAGLYAKHRLSGRRVRLGFDVAVRDQYGRLLAYVYLGNELFNLTLIRLGYARADAVPPDIGMAGLFEETEGQARIAGRGLWSVCAAS